MATRIVLLIVLLSGALGLEEDTPTCAKGSGKVCSAVSETDVEPLEAVEVSLSQFELVQKKINLHGAESMAEKNPDEYLLKGENVHCNDDSPSKYIGLCQANTLEDCQMKCDLTAGCRYVSWVPSNAGWTSDYGNMYRECTTTPHTGRNVYVRSVPYDLVGKNVHCTDDSAGKYLGLCGSQITFAACRIACDETPTCKYVSYVPSNPGWTSDYGNMYAECATRPHTGRYVYVRAEAAPDDLTPACGAVTTTAPSDGVVVSSVLCGSTTYMRLEKGTFDDVGCSPIMDQETCTNAAAALELDETVPRNAGGGTNKPKGCYAAYLARQGGWTLLFAENGAVVNTMNHQHPICSK